MVKQVISGFLFLIFMMPGVADKKRETAGFVAIYSRKSIGWYEWCLTFQSVKGAPFISPLQLLQKNWLYKPGKGEISSYPIREYEPNDSFALATGPLVMGIDIYGEVSGTDCNDYFFFIADRNCRVNIELRSPEAKELNWVLYDCAEPEDVMAWGESSGESVNGSCCIKKGIYLINVYTWGKGGEYSLKVTN